MKNLTLALASIAIVFAFTACGGGQQAPATEDAPAPAPGAAAGPADITLKTTPEPPMMGENTFEVTVMQDGKPVTDAEVSVTLFMLAMPEMKMAEMRNMIPLAHEANGIYRGTGNVMMAGKWDATVMVMRGNQEIGSQKVTVTAK